ncbi:9591_t:CDS:2 [Paraglomus brasilianum]|uniref:9591_t:CDS:1 n=1 Tax=Paraglomus brasilianum TaxID=144538 RepID=A0A9N9D0Q0_9GLOM|nr:9591_t:CDS:2 [Paraglomus brasilianum]
MTKHEPGRQLPNGANDVLRRRTAVCAGYSNLFDALAHKAGLRVWQVTGQAKGAGYEPGDPIKNHPHAWNAVLLDGEYLLIDSTWGSGSVNNQTFTRAFKPFYFLISPMKLIYSHFPDKPSEQYIYPPISLSTFRDMPHVKADFFIAGLQFVKFPPAVIEVQDDWFVVQLEWCAEDDGSWLMGKLEWYGQAVEVLVQRMEGRGERGGRIYNMYCGIPSSGEGKLNYFVLPKSGSGPLAGAFKVINHGTGSSYRPFVQTYSVPFTFSILSPVYQTITINRKVRFEILIFTDDQSTLPDFCVMDPSSARRERMEKLRFDEEERSYLFASEIKIDSKGQWKLAFANGGQGYFSFVAVYDADR